MLLKSRTICTFGFEYVEWTVRRCTERRLTVFEDYTTWANDDELAERQAANALQRWTCR